MSTVGGLLKALRSEKVESHTVDSLEAVCGNMLAVYKDLVVEPSGVLVVCDDALVRTFGSVVVNGGKVIVEGNAQVISEVVA